MRASLKEQLEALRPRIEANEIKRGTRLFAEEILNEAIEKAVRFAAKKEARENGVSSCITAFRRENALEHWFSCEPTESPHHCGELARMRTRR